MSRASLIFAVAVLLLVPARVLAQAKPAQPAVFSQPAVVKEGEILSVKKIWDQGEHNAFTDLIRFQDRWFCTFREGGDHKSANGDVRVLESRDGDQWTSAALLREEGIDLRDPKFSITPDGRLMIVMGGSVMKDETYVTRHSRVAFSRNGRTWTAPQKVVEPRHWLWRVTWFKGQAYGVTYLGGGGLPDKRAGFLFTSSDGVDWKLVTPLDLPGASETTLQFLEDGEMIAYSRSEMGKGQRETRIGSSRPPYKEWTWKIVPIAAGGPNFLVLPDGRWIAGTRARNTADQNSQTALAWMTRESIVPFLKFTSGGDNSYPGLVWHDNVLWVSFYSSHEGRTSIYLAKVKLPPAKK